MVKTISGSDVDINTDGKELISYAVIFTDPRFKNNYKYEEPRENSYNPFGMSDQKKEKTNQRSIAIHSNKYNNTYDSYYFIFKGDENYAINNSHEGHITCIIEAPDIETADKILQKAAEKGEITWENMKFEPIVRFNRHGQGAGSTRKKRAKKSYKKSRRTGSKSSKARRSFK